MPSRRMLKVAEAIREVVSMAILAELKDPRVMGVTVTRAEVTPDLRQAKVYVSIMGDDTKQKLCLHGLRSSAGFLQSKIASEIDLRYTPRLEFVVDEGVKKSIELAAILKRVLPPNSASDSDSAQVDESAHETPDESHESDGIDSLAHPSAADEAP
ncbi:MAG: 30S ribosome-binding factor RbfA [Planctomycetaceae bacterium]|nr:30S ribosome-binding factor RbfA [Planctomycetaceae bacterium]